MSFTICELVTSYARPRMLGECLRSVAAACPDEVIVCDDGSEGFDVAAIARDALGALPHRVFTNPPIPVDERMRLARQGALINRALREVRSAWVSLICDDDLRAPGWYEEIATAALCQPRLTLVRGRWLRFDDGNPHTLDDMPCPMCEARHMTAGNFAWDARLTRDGRCRWPEDQLNCLDDGFLRSLHRAGVNVFRVPEIGFAGHRREHPLVNNNYSDGRDHTEAFRAVLAAGFLEAPR